MWKGSERFTIIFQELRVYRVHVGPRGRCTRSRRRSVIPAQHHYIIHIGLPTRILHLHGPAGDANFPVPRGKRNRVSRAKTLWRDIGRTHRSAVALGVRTHTGGTFSPGARHYSSRSPRWRVWSSWRVAQESRTAVCANIMYIWYIYIYMYCTSNHRETYHEI